MNQQAQDRNGAAARRSARAAAGALAFMLAGALLAPVHASPNEPPRREDPRAQQQQEQQRGESRWGAADSRSFEARSEEQRRIMQENANNAEMTRRASRMTAEDKADLRRSINSFNARQEVPPSPRR